jgi:hypothetical protein
MRLKLFVWTFCTISTLASTGLAGIAADPTASSVKSPEASAAVSDAPKTALPATTKPASTIKLPAEGTLAIEIVRGPDHKEDVALCAQVKELYEKGDFAGLDALADKLLSTKKAFWNGDWYLEGFMTELESVGADQRSNADYEKYIAVLNNWIKKSPKSATARAALVEAWVTYAWKARGNGYANTVTDDGWKLMRERLKKASAVADAAKDIHAPTLYVAEETLALGESWEKPKFNKVFDEGVKYNPDYDDIYYRKLYFLLPRWNGAQGEFESFLSRTADKMGGDKGDMFYARIVYRFHKSRLEGDDTFTNTKLSWKRTKKGFEAMLKQNPNSLGVQSGFAKLATVIGDQDVARAMFAKIGNRCNRDTWTRSEFIEARKKAASDKPVGKSSGAKNEDDEDAEVEK